MDIEKTMKIRFASTPFPAPTCEIASDNEKLAQWFTEIAFMRDFVYRNPRKTPDKEFSDILIIFHDTAIIVQMKTQTGKRPTALWIKNNLNAALRQLNGSARALSDRLVTSFWNDLLKVEVTYDPSRVKCTYGLIVLAADGGLTEYDGMIEPVNRPTIDTNIMSLSDLVHICRIMSTAADFIVYLELRHALSERKRIFINNEVRTMELVAMELPNLMRFGPTADPGKCGKSLQGYRRMLSGSILESADLKYGVLIDDMIAHCHDVDPAFSVRRDSLETLRISQCLGYLTRERRILMGKHMLDRALSARDNGPRLFVHFQRAVGQLYLFLYTGMERKERQQLLYVLARAATRKYPCSKVLAVATEPIGSGRSYDFCVIEETENSKENLIPAEFMALLPELTIDLFEKDPNDK